MTFHYSDISLQEYPGEISLILYSPGCNYYCPWCFNPDLRNKSPITFKQVKEAVEEHRDFITAVVLSGGEPYMNPYLDKIINYLKSTGLKIKINTNGYMPENDRGILTRGWIDYLHISLKPLDLCTCLKSSIYNWMMHGDLLEYSFVYSSTFLPKPLLNKWANQLNKKLDPTHWFMSDFYKPNVFTISQLQVGDCLNPQYNNCSVPTREDLLEIAPLFKNIPRDKLIIETKEYGRENILKEII